MCFVGESVIDSSAEVIDAFLCTGLVFLLLCVLPVGLCLLFRSLGFLFRPLCVYAL